MESHPATEHLRRAMTAVAARAADWSGVIYRACGTKYALRSELVSGRGAFLKGGRWTPRGLVNAVYGSLEPETAMAESLGCLREFGVPVTEAMPLVFVALTVRFQRVLDLTDPTVTARLQVDHATLLGENWRASQRAGQETLSQAVGRAAVEQGLGGLLVPSSRRPGAHNLVLFVENRRRGDVLRIQHPKRLPP